MKRLLLLVLLLLAQPAWAHLPLKMWQAERKASEGKWAEAAALYREALKEQPKNAEATYNLALCLYRQGQFSKAEEQFKKALEYASPGELKGKAAYNLGNTQFRQKDTGPKPEDREKRLKEALDSYKTALRWNEYDDDARYNIQVVLDLLKKPDPPKKNQDKDKDKKNQDDKKKDKKQKPKPDRKPDPKQKPDSKKDQGKSSPTPTPAPPKQQPQQPPPPKPADRDKEDAERMLQFFQNREKDAQKKRFPARRMAPTGEDDW
ncbi:tetratricopeptide repeat protein [bacterium]|nr:tetratricopeptide repeat protein [bacterium]